MTNKLTSHNGISGAEKFHDEETEVEFLGTPVGPDAAFCGLDRRQTRVTFVESESTDDE
jgi:hypothetical protein